MHEELKNDGMPLLRCLKLSVSQAVIFYDHTLLIRSCGLTRRTKTVTLLRIFVFYAALIWGARLRHYATNQQVAGSILDGVI
jgi:hypothetical protein